MSGEDGVRRKRRTAGSRNKLRRHNNIESVIVEEPFKLSVPADTPAALKIEAGIKDGNAAGDGYYVSATNNSSRYYGLLISKEALKAASLLHFKEEAQSLDLNRRMKTLKDRNQSRQPEAIVPASVENANLEPAVKKRKVDEQKQQPIKIVAGARAIQKFQYVPGNPKDELDPGYRILIATYVNFEAAAEGLEEKENAISKACECGGDFVGQFYYQFESITSKLESQKEKEKLTDVGLRTSMGFQTFLHHTPMPIWFPLSNLNISQHKMLSMLQMKRNSKGSIVYDENTAADGANAQGSHLPMEPRSNFRIGIIGGGIAGLACATELLRLGDEEGINLEVVLLEGRSRLGGRLLTDESTFRFGDGSGFPVDLGASWIHGIDHNPLAALAKEANIDFVTASEEVKMIKGNLEPVDTEVDEYMGKLFDTLLDQAADDVWDSEDFVPEKDRNQKAVRWYAETLDKEDATTEMNLRKHDAASHRVSSDVSIDLAIGKAVAKHNHREFRKFGSQENSLLLWNTKNVEYALGANISDLSMKFWDSDERHAFEGDHVLMKQGYSAVVRHLEKGLRSKGDKFKCELNFAAGKIDYARKSTTEAYPSSLDGRVRNLIELSDSCCVTSKDGSQNIKFDCVVSTLPLGVLKHSVEAAASSDAAKKSRGVVFDPPLPFAKVDAIRSTGFGLLNKVYLQFPTAFWRIGTVFEAEDHSLFGNASGLNPHHYMFNDIGKSLGRDGDRPPILMSLISGKEAVECELMEDAAVVKQVVDTLKKLFTPELVPDPVAFKVTRWGGDEFSRGCYTFLPPGATEQDFQILQSPINGNGDSLTLEGSETMRLFWAGEHTTALHPSMAHGALLSGIRAAKEVFSTISFKYNDDRSGFEKMIPMAIFRRKNPTTKLQCSMCHVFGSRVREGSLLALQKGARQVLVHNNCGENSPEVEVKDGRWKHVIKAVNRGKQINCCMCGSVGATIGCSDPNCYRCFHFKCGEDTGWRFDRDGKVYFCDIHRTYENHEENECDQISLKYYKSKRANPRMWSCSFCGLPDNDPRRGKMLAFSQQHNLMAVHDRCARFTTIMETLDDQTAMSDTDFKNLFEVLKRSKLCKSCGKPGATIVCSDTMCDDHYHFACAEDDAGWNFLKKGARFKCKAHRAGAKPAEPNMNDQEGDKPLATVAPPGFPAGLFQHNLFFSGAERVTNGGANGHAAKTDVAVNDKKWERSTTMRMSEEMSKESAKPAALEDTDESSEGDEEDDVANPLTLPLSCHPDAFGTKRVLQLTRLTVEDPWGFDFLVAPNYQQQTNMLLIELTGAKRPGGVEDKDALVVLGVGGRQVGSDGLTTVQEIMAEFRATESISLTVAEHA